MLLWRVGVGDMIVMQGSSPINEKDNFLKVLEEHDTLPSQKYTLQHTYVNGITIEFPKIMSCN